MVAQHTVAVLGLIEKILDVGAMIGTNKNTLRPPGAQAV